MTELQDTFLKELPPLIKRSTYHGESQFLDILESESAHFEASTDTSEFVLFRASKETIKDIFEHQDEDISSVPKFCTSFDLNEELFLVAVPSLPHSVAPCEFDRMIRHSLTPIGLADAVKSYAGATVKVNGRGKQADHAWRPRRQAPGQHGSASVTLEVALGEPGAKLTSDVRFWLSPQDGNANVCFTLQINRTRPEIRVERWERRGDSGIHRTQVTCITKHGDRIEVTDHPLTLSFESLFRRPPSRAEEKDLEFSREQLVELAVSIWEEQGW